MIKFQFMADPFDSCICHQSHSHYGAQYRWELLLFLYSW